MEQQNQPKGALIGSIIIVLIIIVGGIYFASQARQEIVPTQIDQVLSEDEDLQAIQNEESDQNLAELEAELDQVDFSDVDNNNPDDIQY